MKELDLKQFSDEKLLEMQGILKETIRASESGAFFGEARRAQLALVEAEQARRRNKTKG